MKETARYHFFFFCVRVCRISTFHRLGIFFSRRVLKSFRSLKVICDITLIKERALCVVFLGAANLKQQLRKSPSPQDRSLQIARFDNIISTQCPT